MPPPLWEVYVCQSRACRERGADATLDAFRELAPPGLVEVRAAVLVGGGGGTTGPGGAAGKRKAQQAAKKMGRRGPVVRCVRSGAAGTAGGEEDGTGTGSGSDGHAFEAFEATGVDSVDKVYRILTRSMGLGGGGAASDGGWGDGHGGSGSGGGNGGSGGGYFAALPPHATDAERAAAGAYVDEAACEALRHKYLGNAALEGGDHGAAIAHYTRALEEAEAGAAVAGTGTGPEPGSGSGSGTAGVWTELEGEVGRAIAAGPWPGGGGGGDRDWEAPSGGKRGTKHPEPSPRSRSSPSPSSRTSSRTSPPNPLPAIPYPPAASSASDRRMASVLLLRSTAYLRRAFGHQAELRAVVAEMADLVPDPGALRALYGEVARCHPATFPAVARRVERDGRAQERQSRRIRYRHSLYEYSLLNAARDALRATSLLPGSAGAWVRAGDALAELRKLRESARYYERAMELDGSLADRLVPVVERLRTSQLALDAARDEGWPDDAMRLALDVTG